MSAFSFEGRCARLPFFGRCLVGFGSYIVALLCFSGGEAGAVAGLPVLVAAVWLNLASSAQRLHDLGHSGWMQLFNAVPFVGWVFALYMIFAPGEHGSNRFGEEPSP